MYLFRLVSFLLTPFLGASSTTSASILVEFGGNDWAAGCVVAHVFSHMYISPAVRHTPHTRIHCAAMLACEAPDPWLGTQGFDHKAPKLRQGRIPGRESLPRLPLITRCADWRGLRVPCAGDSAAALFAKYIHADYNHALRLSVGPAGNATLTHLLWGGRRDPICR